MIQRFGSYPGAFFRKEERHLRWLDGVSTVSFLGVCVHVLELYHASCIMTASCRMTNLLPGGCMVFEFVVPCLRKQKKRKNKMENKRGG